MAFLVVLMLGLPALFVSLIPAHRQVPSEAFVVLFILSVLGTWLGHPLLIDMDRKRRDAKVGCLSLALAFLFPPLGGVVYLIGAYASRAIAWVPLYLGILSALPAIGVAVAWKCGFR